MQLINNKEARLRSIPVNGKMIQLKPGINEVDEKDLEEALKIKTIAAAFEDGLLENLKDSNAITDLNVKRAAVLIAETFDELLLAKWRSAEKRETVKAAIDKQIEFIKAATA